MLNGTECHGEKDSRKVLGRAGGGGDGRNCDFKIRDDLGEKVTQAQQRLGQLDSRYLEQRQELRGGKKGERVQGTVSSKRNSMCESRMSKGPRPPRK